MRKGTDRRVLLGNMILMLTLLCVGFASCSKKDVYDPEKPEQDAWALYKKNFLAYVGNSINGNVDWGFGRTVKTKNAGTRADKAPNVVLDANGYSTEFDDKFFETVREYFPEKGTCKSTDWWSYEFLQNGEFFNVRLIYSRTQVKHELGLYYYDPAVEDYTKYKKVPLYTIDETDEWNLTNYIQFNRFATGGVWLPYRAHRGYEIWEGDSPAKRIRTRTYTISMDPTYHFGFYSTDLSTNKTYYSNQFLNADPTAYSGGLIGENPVGEVKQSYVFGLTGDDVADCNFLFAIIKAGKDGKYPLLVKPGKWFRIIGEDLNVHDLNHDGNDDNTDFDFNDIVLDVLLTDGGAKCILQAAGATLKIRINGDDNLEVHKLFGVNQDVMVNTKASSKGLKGKDGLSPVEFDIKGSFSSADDINIEVYRQNKWMKMRTVKGDATSKIIVDTDFVWPDERQSLKEKYPKFVKYAQENQYPDSWWK